MSALPRIALIGFGEVGQTLAEDLAGKAEIAVWDVLFADAASGPSRAMSRLKVRAGASAAEAVHGAGLVISAVTAARDLEAAQSVGVGLAKDAFFLDLNSCSPSQKTASAEAIHAAGGRYIEAAVMSPIHPKRIAAPMLLGGPHIDEFLAFTESLGFAGAEAYSEVVGRAAATKLCRSVIIKGVEALLTESLLAARHYGVERVVLDSLSNLLPLPDWNGTAQYMISRALEHGGRRAEEMREAARTVAEAGVPPTMSEAIAERQAWAAHYRGAMSDDLAAMLDAINSDLWGRRP
jgi:3-hydroxyisobutyrate dehydrogenase-like beta-hydroxyacid dehydrogenase